MGRIIKTNYMDIDMDIITFEDMPSEILKEMFILCGKEVAVSIMEQFAGTFITIPARPFEKLERRLAIKEFDGTTASLRKIARTYNIAEPSIRVLLKKSGLKNSIPADGQLNILDELAKQNNAENED